MSPRLRFVGKRLIYAVLTVLLLVTITFLLMHLLPGNPFTGNKPLSPQIESALIAKYGLDKSIFEQYFIYVANIVQGDLGSSLVSGRAVTDIIAQAFPVSLELGLRALVFAVVFGLLLGIVAALKHGTVWDTLLMTLAILGVSIPSFIIGALLQYYLGLVLYQATGVHVFAVMGWSGDNSKLLPAFALAVSSIAVISRLMRTSLLDVLSQDYVRTAQAKGLTRREVVWHHCLRNSITPVVIVMGPLVAVLLTGTFVIENVFSIPGLGSYFVDSIRANDYPVIAGTTLFFGAFLVLCNLVVDVVQSVIDPRVEVGEDQHG